jgi:hypothetical protein
MVALGLLAPMAVRAWRRLLGERQRRVFGAIADARKMAYPAYVRSVDEVVETVVRRADVRVRMPVQAFESFLDGGVYLSQFATKASMGLLDPPLRRLIENSMLGLPRWLPDRRRPVYGYLGGSDEQETAAYGEVRLHLAPSVRRRTFFTLGDSITHTDGGSTASFRAVRCVRPSSNAAYCGDDARDVTAARRLVDAVAPQRRQFDPSFGGWIIAPTYAEAQILGGFTLEEVSEVSFRADRPPNGALAGKMATRGVHWVLRNEP